MGTPFNSLLCTQGSVLALGQPRGTLGGRRHFCSEITGARHRASVTVTGGFGGEPLMKVI